MLLLKLLEHDLHRARKGTNATPLWQETPAIPNCMPAIVSSAWPDKFLISRQLTSENNLRSGIFPYDADMIDAVLHPMLSAAMKLSVEDKLGNVFAGKDGFRQAFSYIQRKSCMPDGQPHILLVPSDMDEKPLTGAFKGKYDAEAGHIHKMCRVHKAKVPAPCFFSRPDFVGVYTQFLGGKSSIILHNVRNSMAFVTL